MHHSTGLWLASLACLMFGFVPLLVVGVTAAMEFAWLFITDPQALGWPASGLGALAVNVFNQVFHDWTALYTINEQFDTRLFVAQLVCAIFWFAYMCRMRWRWGQR